MFGANLASFQTEEDAEAVAQIYGETGILLCLSGDFFHLCIRNSSPQRGACEFSKLAKQQQQLNVIITNRLKGSSLKKPTWL